MVKARVRVFDGDIVFSTNDKTMVNCIYENRLPITYDKESAPAQKMTVSNMIKTDLNTFNCKIGQTTNYSTKFFSMLCNHEPDTREYKELVDRIKMLRRYIGDSIDAGKGVKTKPFPKEWKSWNRVPEDWDEERRKEQWFLNNLVEKRKPYFFVYIYEAEMERYKSAKKKLDNECKNIFGCKFNELKNKDVKTQEEKNFVKHYYNELPVTKTKCIMNKICWKIEGIEFEYKYPKSNVEDNLIIANKLMKDPERRFMKSKLDRIRHIFKDYKANNLENHKSLSMKIMKNSNEIEEFFDDNESFVDTMKDEFAKDLEQVVPNEQELADYLVYMAYIENKSPNMKHFCWTFGGKGIVKTLLEKNNAVTVPVECENGKEYLGEYYELVEVTADGDI